MDCITLLLYIKHGRVGVVQLLPTRLYLGRLMDPNEHHEGRKVDVFKTLGVSHVGCFKLFHVGAYNIV